MQLIHKHKISLLAFDLDGTLLNSAGSISLSNMQMLRCLMDKGVKVTICSGRITYRLQFYVQQLDFKGPYVACNGNLVVNSADDSIIFSKSIARDDLDKLTTFLRKSNLHLSLHTLAGVYHTLGNPRVVRSKQSRQLAEKQGLPDTSVYFLPEDYGYHDKNLVYKAAVHVPEGSDYTELINFLDQQPGLNYAFSDRTYLEISPQGTGKGRGIERVADFYGIPLSEVCAFGDYDNDIPCFERAGITVAMGNASENLKVKAMYVTDTNDNDGIGKALTALAGCF